MLSEIINFFIVARRLNWKQRSHQVETVLLLLISGLLGVVHALPSALFSKGLPRLTDTKSISTRWEELDIWLEFKL